MAMNFPGSIFIGMIVTAFFGMIIGQIPLPHGIISGVKHGNQLLVKQFFTLKTSIRLNLMVVLTFLLVTFFDTAGTLIGMTEQAGMVDKNGKIPPHWSCVLS